MPHIHCQILHGPERITIVWSQGKQYFEPYALMGADRERFEQLAQQGRTLLAGGSGAAELARVGQGLHELLFHGEVGREVRGWLEGLSDVAIEIVSNAPERVPVNILRAEGGDAPEGYWGMRYPLTQGRRVGSLGLRPYIQDAQVTVALDPGFENSLSEDERRQVEMFSPRVCRSAAELHSAIRSQAPDFLVICVRVEGEHMLLGTDRLQSGDVSAMFAEAEAGSLAPIVMLLAETKNAPAWSCFLAGANRTFAGLIAFETPTSAGLQIQAASAVLDRIGQQLPLGVAMQQARNRLGAAGLGWTAYAPPHVRVIGPDETPEPTGLRLYSLPAEPFRPLRPLDREDRCLLMGRDHDIAALGRLIDQVETRGVILHGPAGVGKASLLRAGLLPHLEEGQGYCVLRDRREMGPEDQMPTLALRPGLDLAASLTEAITSFAAAPYTYTTPTGRTVTVDLPMILNRFASNSEGASGDIQDLSKAAAAAITGERPPTLWDALVRRPETWTELWNALTARLPREVVVAIEHGEDLAKLPNHAFALLNALTRVERGKVVLSLRWEYLGALQERMLASERTAWRTYALRELRNVDLRAIVELPGVERPIAHAAQAPASKYEVRFNPTAIDSLLSRAIETSKLRGMSAVTIVQIVAATLERTVKGMVLLRDIRKFPFHAAVTQFLDATGRRLALSRPDRKALRPFLGALTESGPGGTMLEPLLPLQSGRARWQGPTPYETILTQLAQPGVNLVQVEQAPVQGQMQALIGLGHHGLTAIPGEIAEENDRKKFSSTKLVDAMFIFVPLLLLACAATIFFMRRSAANDLKEQQASINKSVKKAIESQEELHERRLDQMRQIVMAGCLPLAEQAIRRGDPLSARDYLLALQPNQGDFDDRSFEWYYLWKQVAPEKTRLEGQREAVTALAASSDGKILASADAAGVIRLWNMKAEPDLGAELRGGKGHVHALAFVPGDKEIVAAYDDGSLRLWATTMGDAEPVRAAKEARLIGKHQGAALSLAFADAKTLVSGGDDRKVLVWDVAAGKKNSELDLEAPVRAVAVTPDGKTFVAAAGKSAVFADVASGKKSKDIAVHDSARIDALAFVSPDSLALGTTESASGEEQGRLHLWDLKANKDSAAILDHGNGITTLAVWRDKGIVFTGGKDRVIRIWQAKDGKELRAIQGHLGEIRSLALLDKSGLLASAAHDNAIKLIDLPVLLQPDTIAAHKGGVRSVAIAPERNLIASGGMDGLVRFWLPSSSESVGMVKLDAPVSALEFAMHDKQLVLATGTWSANDKGEAKLWKVALTGDKLEATPWHTLTDVTIGVRGLSFDARGKSLAAVTPAAVWIGDVATGKRTGILPLPRDTAQPLTCARFDPSGLQIVGGNVLGNLIFWNVAAQEVEVVLSNAHGSAVVGVVSRGSNGTPSTCSVGDDQRFTRALREPQRRFALQYQFRINQFPHCLAAGKDRVLVIGDESGIVTFYDLHFDREKLRVPAHEGPVRGIAVSPDQKLVVSGGDDGTLRLFRGDFPKKRPTPIPIRTAQEEEPDE